MSEPSNRISAKEAAKDLGYAPEYVAYLCRSKKLMAERGSEGWSIESSSLEKYKRDIEEQKHLRAKTLSREWRKESRETRQVQPIVEPQPAVPPPPPAPASIVVIQEHAPRNYSWLHGVLGMVAGLVLLFSAALAAERTGIYANESVTGETQSASIISAVGEIGRAHV